MHKMDSRNDFCEDCGVTGLELLQEPRLAAQCDYDLVQEYRALTYEYSDAVAALFVPAGQLYPEFKREEPVAVDKVTPVKELTVLEAWRQMNDAKDPVKYMEDDAHKLDDTAAANIAEAFECGPR